MGGDTNVILPCSARGGEKLQMSCRRSFIVMEQPSMDGNFDKGTGTQRGMTLGDFRSQALMGPL